MNEGANETFLKITEYGNYLFRLNGILIPFFIPFMPVKLEPCQNLVPVPACQGAQ